MSDTFLSKNYFLLALSIVYFIIGVIQLTVDGILSVNLYFSITSISLVVSTLEFSKSLCNWLHVFDQHFSDMESNALDFEKKHMKVFGASSILSPLAQEYKKTYESMLNKSKQIAASRSERWKKKFVGMIYKIEHLFPFLEAFIVVFFGLFFPLLEIPNNAQTTKIINVLSLFSVSLIFVSIYINEYTSEMINNAKRRMEDRSRTSDYYLSIIKSLLLEQAAAQEAPLMEEERKGIQNDNN